MSIVVAVDFGTMYSGVAWAQTKNVKPPLFSFRVLL